LIASFVKNSKKSSAFVDYRLATSKTTWLPGFCYHWLALVSLLTS